MVKTDFVVGFLDFDSRCVARDTEDLLPSQYIILLKYLDRAHEMTRFMGNRAVLLRSAP